MMIMIVIAAVIVLVCVKPVKLGRYNPDRTNLEEFKHRRALEATADKMVADINKDLADAGLDNRIE